MNFDRVFCQQMFMMWPEWRLICLCRFGSIWTQNNTCTLLNPIHSHSECKQQSSEANKIYISFGPKVNLETITKLRFITTETQIKESTIPISMETKKKIDFISWTLKYIQYHSIAFKWLDSIKCPIKMFRWPRRCFVRRKYTNWSQWVWQKFCSR